MSLGNLITRDFPEFKDISGKLLSDETKYDMLSEDAHCKNLSDKFLATDERRNEYNTIKDELHNEIRQRVLRSFYHQH